MKRILIVSALYPPHIGGVERFVKNLSSELAKKGDAVTVVTSALQKDSGVTYDGKVKVVRLPSIPLMGGRLPVLLYSKEFRKLRRELSRQKYDLCMVNTRFYFISLWGVMFAKRKKCKCFVLDHGSAHLSFGNLVLDFAERIYEHFITTLVKWNCKNFYGISLCSCDFLKHFHIHPKGVIHNAIDCEEIQRVSAECDFNIYDIANLPENAVIICYIGRIIYRKGILELNAAIAELIKEYPDLYLVYAGDGELMEKLRSSRSDHTIILGQLPYGKAMCLMRQSHIFCLPSETEGFPTSVLEAVANKTFVITTTAGGSKELIVNERYGIIMGDNTKQSIEEAVKKAMNAEYRNKAVQNCYEELVKNYSWHTIAEQVRAIVDM